MFWFFYAGAIVHHHIYMTLQLLYMPGSIMRGVVVLLLLPQAI